MCVIVCNCHEAGSQSICRHPMKQFLVFAAYTSSWADCILGNGKPQSRNHPSVLTLHIGQQLTHACIHTLTFTATHIAHNLSMRLLGVCSSSMTEGFMGSFTTFSSPVLTSYDKHQWASFMVWFLMADFWQAMCWPILNTSSCTLCQWSAKRKEKFRMTIEF